MENKFEDKVKFEKEAYPANPNMIRVNVRITKELHAMYKAESEKTGISMSILMYKDLEQQAGQRTIIDQLPTMIRELKNLGALVDNDTKI